MERGRACLSRRQFMLGAVTAGSALLTRCGPLPFQQPPPTAVKVHRLGYLSGTNPTAQVRNLDTFRQALGELGYVEGQNLAIEFGGAKAMTRGSSSLQRSWPAYR